MIMKELAAYRQALLERFTAIIGDMTRAAACVDQDGASGSEDWEAWNLHQVLAHLRDKEAQFYSLAIQRILNETWPQLAGFDSMGWMAGHYRPDEPISSILEEYARLRQLELDWLYSLSELDWNRLGWHPYWGWRTLQWWVEKSLAHARRHLAAYDCRE